MSGEARGRYFLRNIFVWLIIFVPTLFLCLGGYYLHATKSSLDLELQMLRADGMPTSLQELNQFYKVQPRFQDRTTSWVAAIDAVEGASLKMVATGLPFVGTGSTPVPPPGENWPQLEAARELLTDSHLPLELVWEAARVQGHVRFPIDFSSADGNLVPHTHNCRSVARLLLLDAHASAHDGHPEQALQDLNAIFSLCNAFGPEPILSSQFVRIAIYHMACDGVQRLLPYCRWNEAQLDSLRSAIHSAHFKADIQRALQGERAFCLGSIDGLPTGPLRVFHKKWCLIIYEDALDNLSYPWPEALSKQQDLTKQIQHVANGFLPRQEIGPLVPLLPMIESTFQAGARAAAKQICAQAGIAAQRWRLQSGRLPDTFQELSQAQPDYGWAFAQPLTDPFTGKPLLVKSIDDGLLIYSVGENLVDDGGDIIGDGKRTLDIGFKVKR